MFGETTGFSGARELSLAASYAAAEAEARHLTRHPNLNDNGRQQGQTPDSTQLSLAGHLSVHQ